MPGPVRVHSISVAASRHRRLQSATLSARYDKLSEFTNTEMAKASVFHVEPLAHPLLKRGALRKYDDIPIIRQRKEHKS